MKQVVFRIEDAEHRALKVKAAGAGVGMAEVLRELVRRYIGGADTGSKPMKASPEKPAIERPRLLTSHPENCGCFSCRRTRAGR
jgi:hypothetical protein